MIPDTHDVVEEEEDIHTAPAAADAMEVVVKIEADMPLEEEASLMVKTDDEDDGIGSKLVGVSKVPREN